MTESSALEAVRAPTLPTLLADVSRHASLLGRPDVARRVDDAGARLERRGCVIAVCGEFKRGKSSLLNGLLGQRVLPVDAERSTAVPVIVSHGPVPHVSLLVEDGGDHRAIAGSLEDLPSMVLEEERPGRLRPLVATVELPAEILEGGMSFVDTPGAGGVSSGFIQAALGYLRSSDCGLVVCDGGSPLSSATLDFIRQAATIVPNVVVTPTFTDLSLGWREMAEHIRGQLSAHDLAIPVFPVSNTLRTAAFATGDDALDEESGFRALTGHLTVSVVGKMQAAAREFAAREARWATSTLGVAIDAEIEALSGNAASARRRIALDRERLDRLRIAGGRWPTVLSDTFGDALNRADFEARAAIRQLSRHLEERIDGGDPLGMWDELAAKAREEAAKVAADSFQAILGGAALARQRIAEMVGDALDAVDIASPEPLTEAEEWKLSALERRGSVFALGAGGTYSGLKGAQGGIVFTGVLAGVVGLGLGTVAVFAVGALFGGKQLLEDRKRRIRERRQHARGAVRQFCDEVLLQVNKTIRDVSRDEQRFLRDYFSAQVPDLIGSAARSIETLNATLSVKAGERDARLAVLTTERAELAAISRTLAELQA